MLSYKCSAKCKHCMYVCSPKWKGDWIIKDKLEEGLPILARYIKPSPYGHENMSLNHGLHFSGGEPFLNFELLLKTVEIAEALRIPSTFVETNCSWCKDDTFTRYRLQLLKEKGLKGIMISVNPFYPATSFFNIPCQPPILRNWHNHFDNYGNLMPVFLWRDFIRKLV